MITRIVTNFVLSLTVKEFWTRSINLS